MLVREASWRHVPLFAGAGAFLVGLTLAAALKHDRAAAASDSPAASRDAPTVTPPGPAPTSVAETWWCMCYRVEVGEGDRMVTTCRASASECDVLRRRMDKKSDVVPGSVGRCQATPGPFPWQRLGAPALWQASDKKGAYVSYGSCLLP